VRTNVSQFGFGREVGDVTTSTTSPDCSSVRNGDNSLLMRAAMHVLPMSVWIWYAKSIGVAPRGSVMIFDFGVNT